MYPKKKVTLVLGISNDKDINKICRSLSEISKSVIVTKANHPRGSDLRDKMEELFPNKKCFCTDDVHQALQLADQICDDQGIVLVTGSFFVVSEARTSIFSNRHFRESLKLCTN